MNNKEAGPIGVAIVAEDTDAREELTAVVNRAPELQCVSTHTRVSDMSDTVLRLRPKVVLVGAEVLQARGGGLIRRLQEAVPGLLVLVVSASAEGGLIWGSLRAGANGYLHADRGYAAVPHAVLALVRNGAFVCERALVALVGAAHRLPVNGHPGLAALTRRELEILALLVGEIEKEIAAKRNLSTQTVHDYLKVIYKKLGVHSREDAIRVFLDLR